MNKAALSGMLFAVSVTAAAAQPHTPITPNPASENAALKAELKADVATVRAQEKSAAVTRQQIQAIRAALRAKLATLHH